ncbi:hypothetical protein, partial [Thermoclostridium caenicola]|uniref:hypothetical protein n=1 Tax=Thermoclostridium caenicola TaxID=659425 RepID=UPI001A9AA5DB
PFILSILGYIFDISKKTGILTHVKMPVFRQSGRNPRVPVFFLSFEEGLFHIIHKLSTVYLPC